MKDYKQKFKTKAVADKWARKVLKDHFPANAGWTYRLLDNDGWHVTFENGPYIDVMVHDVNGMFWCLIGSECGAPCEWCPNPGYYDTDPLLLVNRTLAYIRDQITADLNVFDNMCSCVGSPHRIYHEA